MVAQCNNICGPYGQDSAIHYHFMVQDGITAVCMIKNQKLVVGCSELCQNLKVMHLILRTKGDGGWRTERECV